MRGVALGCGMARRVGHAAGARIEGVGGIVLALVVAAAVVAPTPGAAQFTGWTEPMEPFRIGEDLYYVGTVGLGAYLFTSEEGHVLIDAPLEENVPLVLDNIRALGVDPEDIRIHLASHAHFDHVGGMETMLGVTGGALVLSSGDAEYVRAGSDFGLDTDGYAAAEPDRIVGDGETVGLGDIEVTANVTPGHTPGCTSWSGSVVIEGDPYTFVSVCSLTVLGAYTITGDQATYEGQARDFCRSVERLRELDPDVFLGAHGSWFGLEEKIEARRAGDPLAFVEGERYREYLEGAEESIEERLAEEGHGGGCAALLG